MKSVDLATHVTDTVPSLHCSWFTTSWRPWQVYNHSLALPLWAKPIVTFDGSRVESRFQTKHDGMTRIRQPFELILAGRKISAVWRTATAWWPGGLQNSGMPHIVAANLSFLVASRCTGCFCISLEDSIAAHCQKCLKDSTTECFFQYGGRKRGKQSVCAAIS